jgi:Transglycosylase SLT domain
MRRVIPILLALLANASLAHASSPKSLTLTPPINPSAYCDTAIVNAERTIRLPARLLGAIGEVESGRPDDKGIIRPWPWTINAEGRGQFFATKQDAIAAVRALQASGVRSIDVGCMQVNLMYHPNAFASLDEAFDPPANALYAARFLNSLYGASQSWVQATAAYHSETPAIGADYQRRVASRWQNPHLTAVAYGLFAPAHTAYDDFKSPSLIYGAFSTQRLDATPRLARR